MGWHAYGQEFMNIVLIGFMGCGKSTVAEKLGEMLDREVVETDGLIELEQGKHIAEIFADAGESAFRRMERQLAERLSEREGLVISTGGGMVTVPETAALLKANGFIVLLDTPFALCYRRIAGDPRRPNASGRTRGELQTLYDDRLPLYRAAADLAVNGEQEADCLAEEILRCVRAREGGI